MSDAPSLVLATSRRCWERLRRESGARALALSDDAALQHGRVRWLPLSDDDLGSDGDRSDAAWAMRFRPIAATPQAPLVLLWDAPSRGESRHFLDAVNQLGSRMLRIMQGDRVPPRVAAVLYVAGSGLDESDAIALETVASAGRNLPDGAPELPPGLAEILGRRGRPTYLMSARTRASACGDSWDVSAVWPVEVGRLLASLEASPLRQPGLRAWRSVRFNPTQFPFEQLELEAFRLAREAIGLPEAGLVGIEEGTGRQLPPLRAPESSVSVDRAPQHCLDSVSRPGPRPVLPSWWNLAADSAEATAHERTDTFGMRGGRASRWYRRFWERGERFIDERRKRSLESLEETVGPKSVCSKVWRAIHDDPSLANWFGSGQFYVGPDTKADAPTAGLRLWSALSDVERSIIRHRSRATVTARELDCARAHFVGTGWRFLCAGAAALFIGTVFAALFRSSDWRWALAMPLAASAGAIAASAIVLWLEARAGRRGRDSVERSIEHAELGIGESFVQRMRIGAAGERAGRRRRWFQSAARTRDVASRLKAIADIAETDALRHAAADAPEQPAHIQAYAAATTIDVAGGVLPIEAVRSELKSDPSRLIELRRRDYAGWWSRTLRVEDPLFSGAVRERCFGPKLVSEVAEIVDRFRRDLIAVLERIESRGADLPALTRQFAAVLGPVGDLRNLGVRTQRASGRNCMGVVWVHGLLSRHARRVSHALESHYGHGVAPQPIVSEIDRWGCLGLVIEEVSIGFRGQDSGAFCLDPHNGVQVFEGLDVSEVHVERGGVHVD